MIPASRRSLRLFLSIILSAFSLYAQFSLEKPAYAQSTAPGIKTDYRVYQKPALPALPRAGGTFIDPVFGTEIMRATDESDGGAPGLGNYYSHWPTFNSDNTKILIRKGENGDAIIKDFDPINFKIGATHRLPNNLPGSASVSWQGATWSSTDPNILYCHAGYYDGGMKIYEYDVRVGTSAGFRLIKDLTSLGGGQDYLQQMYVSADGDVFCFMQMRPGRDGVPLGYIVYKRSTDQVLFQTSNTVDFNEVHVDKTGKWMNIPLNRPLATGASMQFLNLETGQLTPIVDGAPDYRPGHGDLGSNSIIGFDNDLNGITFRRMDSPHNPLHVFFFRTDTGINDWTHDMHATMLATNEDWVTVGTYNDPEILGLPDTGVFDDEIFQVSLDGSQRIRRICHTRSLIDNKTNTSGYWAMPKPTISRDGRFIAFTSNWEKSGRYDLFIARIEPAPSLSQSQPTSPSLVSNARANANALAGNANSTGAQIDNLVASIKQAYDAFLVEASRFASAGQIETGLRVALYFSRAAAALAVTGNSPAGVQSRLQIAAAYLAQVQNLMSPGTATVQTESSHAASSMTFFIGSADTRSSASFTPVLAPSSLGIIQGDAAQSPLASQTKSVGSSTSGPLPYELAGVSVTIGGKSAQLFSVSPSRISFYVPEGLPSGEAEVIVTLQEGYVSRGTVNIAPLAPSIFTTSGDGTGAGVVLNAATQSRGSFDVTTAANFGADKRTRLMILATGFSASAANTNTMNDVRTGTSTLVNLAESISVQARARDGRTWTLPVEFAGTPGTFPGLDQVNVRLLPEMRGAGDVELTILVGTVRSNTATVTIK